MDVLKALSDANLLGNLIFGGGTCLRLCFGLNRYSVDLDFWQTGPFDAAHFNKIKRALSAKFTITDSKSKHFTWLIELRSADYPKKFKIEIRKGGVLKFQTELNIAFSAYSGQQVRLTTMTLVQMWQNKVSAFLERGEIRDAYDLEFIYKKAGTACVLTDEQKAGVLAGLQNFKEKDFKVKLGFLLPAGEREYYNKNGFKLLITAIK
jgi:predicted nucleotidyltransferase component of viral defense system